MPTIERVVAFCRTPERLAAFCKETGAEPAETANEAAAQEIVVTVTTSRDPVLRGDWLQPGRARLRRRREHPPRPRARRRRDPERAAFVCCDSIEQARIESGDLIEPVEHGTLDWLEVHELPEVVGGEVAGRQNDDDIVVFKSNGIAAWDVAAAAATLDRALPRRRGPRALAELGTHGGDGRLAERVDHVRACRAAAPAARACTGS